MHWVDQICSDFGWSINELARRAGISPGTLGNAKRRKTQLNNMNYNIIMKLSRATGIEPEVLVFKYDV